METGAELVTPSGTLTVNATKITMEESSRLVASTLTVTATEITMEASSRFLESDKVPKISTERMAVVVVVGVCLCACLGFSCPFLFHLTFSYLL